MASSTGKMQVIDGATGDFTDVAQANLVAQIDVQAKAAIEANFNAWLGENGDELSNCLPTFFGQVAVLYDGVQGLVTGQEELGKRLDVLTGQLNERMPEVSSA